MCSPLAPKLPCSSQVFAPPTMSVLFPAPLSFSSSSCALHPIPSVSSPISTTGCILVVFLFQTHKVGVWAPVELAISLVVMLSRRLAALFFYRHIFAILNRHIVKMIADLQQDWFFSQSPKFRRIYVVTLECFALFPYPILQLFLKF